MQRSTLLVILLAAGFHASASAAAIYKCAGPQGGATVFSQVPCGSDAQVAGSGAKPPSNPAADASNDKTTLAEIDGRCESRSRKIVDDYRARFADANASIAELHNNAMKAGTLETDPVVLKQINVVEAHKTDLLGAQDRELSELRNQCQAERSAEIKRESDRDAARALAKR